MTVEPLVVKVRQPRQSRVGTTPLSSVKHPMLVLLHGAGSDEMQLFGMADEIDDRWLVVGVRAPIAQAKGAFVWYRVSPFDISRVNETDVLTGAERLTRTLQDALAAWRADPAQVFLLGVDQGATMALNLFLMYPALVSGVAAFAGATWDSMRYAATDRPALKGKPLFLAYGAHDTVIPLQVARQARKFFLEYEMDVTYREYHGVTHSLQRRVWSDMLVWTAERMERTQRRRRRVRLQARLGYVTLRVRNLERSMLFYQRFLGLRLVERVGRAYVFLSGSGRHHDLALFHAGTDALDQPSGTIGVSEMAFEVPDQRVFAQVYRKLEEARLPVKAIDRLIAWELRFSDPDGNRVVVYCDNRDLPGAADLWQGRDLPLPREKIFSALSEGDV